MKSKQFYKVNVYRNDQLILSQTIEGTAPDHLTDYQQVIASAYRANNRKSKTGDDIHVSLMFGVLVPAGYFSVRKFNPVIGNPRFYEYGVDKQ
jgi:hypothetical protein